ncbi:protein S40-1-like [Rhododendron vialii]|uniref:protein S40-1-like n=1 Tax=Rhododendron vialii TaxID=182163 RepID=UPI00265F4AAF|nr:protein S40-1-like [Rhododendron vialii]
MEEELEFLESEVIFQENVLNEEGVIFPGNFKSQNSRSKKPRRRRRKKKKSSIPINVPENVSGNPWIQAVETDFFDDDDEGEQFVPPHVILGRRISDGKMAFSVCTGNGRTLKGRDLSQVRNSILRMTGFLET